MYVCTILLFAACSVSKFVPDENKLFTGNIIEFTGENKVAQEQVVRDGIEASVYPKPNRKLLGLIYFNLWVYYNFNESKDKWWSKFLYNRFAEEPIYLEDVNIQLSKQIVLKEMQDEGYFNSKINSQVLDKKNTAKIKYSIDPSPPTIMGQVTRPSGENEVDSLVNSFRRMSVKEGDRYRLEAFDIERTQLTEYIRSKGYFDFKNLDIFYLIDTMSLDSVKIKMRIKTPEKDSLHRKYHIRKVNVYTTNGALGSGSISKAKSNYVWKDLNVYEDFKYIDKRTLVSNILINPGSLFSVTDYNLTLSRLINLNIFKYVNIQYEKSAVDSLDVNILLTPTEYKDLTYSTEVNTSDRSFLGSTISTSFNNNNTFRKAEKFSASLSGGVEFQYLDNTSQLSILNLNGSLKYQIPRLLVPFPTKQFKSSVAPKTVIRVEDDYQLWLQYFNTNSFNILYGYEWKTDNNYSFSLQPIFMNYLNVFRTTEVFDSIARVQPLLSVQYQDNLSLGSQFNISHTNRLSERQRNSYVLRWNIETSGNTSTLITKEITGVPIAQYIRSDIEYRFIRKFTLVENLLARVGFGIVDAYGNSSVAPFTKQFFIGGPTTLRGFEFRSVGPGRYKSKSEGGFANPIDQSGDIRILLNTEYRFPIASIFRGALFFDAGNVWLFNNDPDRPGGQFNFNTFYKELAWNTGFGIRADIDYIAVRLDFGIPLYEPYETIGQRWIYQSPEVGISSWISKNIVLSAGIGYPF